MREVEKLNGREQRTNDGYSTDQPCYSNFAHSFEQASATVQCMHALHAAATCSVPCQWSTMHHLRGTRAEIPPKLEGRR